MADETPGAAAKLGGRNIFFYFIFSCERNRGSERSPALSVFWPFSAIEAAPARRFGPPAVSCFRFFPAEGTADGYPFGHGVLFFISSLESFDICLTMFLP